MRWGTIRCTFLSSIFQSCKADSSRADDGGYSDDSSYCPIARILPLIYWISHTRYSKYPLITSIITSIITNTIFYYLSWTAFIFINTMHNPPTHRSQTTFRPPLPQPYPRAFNRSTSSSHFHIPTIKLAQTQSRRLISNIHQMGPIIDELILKAESIP